MALTDAQIVTVRRMLGHPIAGVGDLSGFDAITDRLALLTSAEEDAVVELVTDWTAAGTGLDGARDSAGIKRADEVEWFAGGAASELRRERDRLAQELADLLGVPRRNRRRMGGHTLRG